MYPVRIHVRNVATCENEHRPSSMQFIQDTDVGMFKLWPSANLLKQIYYISEMRDFHAYIC